MAKGFSLHYHGVIDRVGGFLESLYLQERVCLKYSSILFIFRNNIFSLFHFVLQQSISDMTARWSEIPAAEENDSMLGLKMRLLI